MLPPLKGLAPEKEIFRMRLKAERKLAYEKRPDAGKFAASYFMAEIPRPEGAVVALYHPIGSELDTVPLFDALTEEGVTVALPVTPKRKAALTFRAFRRNDPLVEGRNGVMEPGPDLPEVLPDIVVVPLLGFTAAGARLGYGGGYYDRTLDALRGHGQESRDILAVGYGYGAQEVDALPVGPLDQKLDWVVTERGAFRAVS